MCITHSIEDFNSRGGCISLSHFAWNPPDHLQVCCLFVVVHVNPWTALHHNPASRSSTAPWLLNFLMASQSQQSLCIVCLRAALCLLFATHSAEMMMPSSEFNACVMVNRFKCLPETGVATDYDCTGSGTDNNNSKRIIFCTTSWRDIVANLGFNIYL